MCTITISLEDEDLHFLRVWSQAHGTSAEAFLARQAHNLRAHLESPPGHAVTAATGIIDPAVDAIAAHREHLERKHG